MKKTVLIVEKNNCGPEHCTIVATSEVTGVILENLDARGYGYIIESSHEVESNLPSINIQDLVKEIEEKLPIGHSFSKTYPQVSLMVNRALSGYSSKLLTMYELFKILNKDY